MKADLYIELRNVPNDSGTTIGPFTYVQVAYNTVEVGQPKDDGEDEVAYLLVYQDGYWFFLDDIDAERPFTDFIISTQP